MGARGQGEAPGLRRAEQGPARLQQGLGVVDGQGAAVVLGDAEQGRMPVAGVSALEREGLDELAAMLYDALQIIRVYTKAPGQKADLSEPVILKRDATIGEAAAAIHKDFKRELKYAVVWGSGRFQGQTVSKSHVLQDGDVVEFHV